MALQLSHGICPLVCDAIIIKVTDVILTWNCVVVILLQSLAATVAVRMIWMLLFLER